MNKIMSPSEITQGQIDKAVAIYRAMLEKNAKDFQSGPVQAVLGSPELARGQLKLFRNFVEARGPLITLTTAVDRSLNPKNALLATGRVLNIDYETLSEWPIFTGDVVEMRFYKFGRPIQSSSLNQELLEVGLELVADLVGQAAINQNYPQFAATHPNGTQIKNAAGKNVYMSFGYWVEGPNVSVLQREIVWGSEIWFPVVRI